MADPLTEQCEEAWISALNRFDIEIWPLFEGRGYTKGEAHLLWMLSGVCLTLDAIVDDRSELT